MKRGISHKLSSLDVKERGNQGMSNKSINKINSIWRFYSYSFLRNGFIIHVVDFFGINVSMRWWRETKLMHHPLGFGAFSSTTTIVYERFLETNANRSISRVNGTIDACSFPETRTSHSVWSYAIPILPSSSAKKIPFLVPRVVGLCISYSLDISTHKNKHSF